MSFSSWQILPVTYFLLLVPVGLFLISLFIWPTMSFDTASGFFALRSMLDGGPFNYVVSPDPHNIARDAEEFLTWWTPGQYLVPGFFVYLGASDGIAMSLTALLTVIVGTCGWLCVAKKSGASAFVIFCFGLGLVTFRYTLPFDFFNGGEMLLFAVSPWLWLALTWALQKHWTISFGTSLLSFALFFFAKLSGLIIFSAVVGGISAADMINRRWVSSALLALWGGLATGALLFYLFWLSQGKTPASAPQDLFTWADVSFPIAAVIFSGISAFYCLEDIYILAWRGLMHSPIADVSRPTISGYASYFLAPLGLLLMWWVWLRLRETPFRNLALNVFLVLGFCAAAYVFMFVHSRSIAFEERYFYFVGILSFMLILIALDQQGTFGARLVMMSFVSIFASYGLLTYAHAMTHLHRYDRASRSAMAIISPAVLQYLRDELDKHDWQEAVVAIPEPEAANGLPGYRTLFSFYFQDYAPLAEIEKQRWSGRAEKIFIILDRAMLNDGKAQAVLRDFVDYDRSKWDETKLDDMVIFSQ